MRLSPRVVDQVRMHTCRILVVEDDLACAEAVCEILDDAGHPNLWTAGPPEALAAVGRDPTIGVILLDLHLPEIDGVRLLSQIQTAAGPRAASIQTILCSGAAGLGDLDAAMRSGVGAFLAKPLGRADLLNATVDAARRYADLERDRTLRSGLVERCRRLEDTMGDVARELAELTGLPTATRPDPVAPADAPGVDQAWHALQCARLQREAQNMDRLLGRFGIDPTAWRILLALREAELADGDASATGIALASGASATAGLRRIAELEGRELVSRQADPCDARRAMLQLTAEGRSMARAAVETIAAWRAA